MPEASAGEPAEADGDGGAGLAGGAGPRNKSARNWRGRIGLFLGPALFFAILSTPQPDGLPVAAWRTLAMVTWMATWWVTEPVPLAVTALLPLVLGPMLRIFTLGEAATPYAHPLIFLFLGGFLIALSMQRVGLHRRIALWILSRVGSSPRAIVAGFMVAAAALSMWVSNTATVLMMLPIALSVIELTRQSGHEAPRQSAHLAVALLLGLAYAASIGGLATLIGTPPNAFLAAFMQDNYGIEIRFGTWMLIGLPIVLLALPAAWFLLTRVAYPLGGGKVAGWAGILARERGLLGPMAPGETRVAMVFASVALLWTTQPLWAHLLPVSVTDTTVALMGSIALFLIPRGGGLPGNLLSWDDTRRLPWGVLLLFGGGLSLAAAMEQSGLSAGIGNALLVVQPWPILVIVIAITALVTFITELTSNTATAATFIPVVAALGLAIGHDPLLFAVPAALAASAAFMLPVATPPNAIVYSSGHVSVPQMLRAGILLNVMAITVLTLVTYALVGIVFGQGR